MSNRPTRLPCHTPAVVISVPVALAPLALPRLAEGQGMAVAWTVWGTVMWQIPGHCLNAFRRKLELVFLHYLGVSWPLAHPVKSEFTLQLSKFWCVRI